MRVTYLVGDQTLILARVLVLQVERVARELHTTGLLPLNEGGAVAAYSILSVSDSLPIHRIRAIETYG